MKISVLTIFPEMFRGFEEEPVIRRAILKGAVQIEYIDVRPFAGGSFRHIDDSTFGGGAGMVLRCAPVLKALETVRESGSFTAALTPAGVIGATIVRESICENIANAEPPPRQFLIPIRVTSSKF